MVLLLYLSWTIYAVASALQTLPPIHNNNNNNNTRGFSLSNIDKIIYIDAQFASLRDTDGLTLIPPSAGEFAETFRRDLEEITGYKWQLKLQQTVDSDSDSLLPRDDNATGIFLDGLLQRPITYENGQPTSEAYSLSIQPSRITMKGTGARGIWWATRTFLQHLLIAKNQGTNEIPAQEILDAPAHPTRGYMLDAGRKWYAASFLKELCTYASFFKMSEFHYHVSDNYPLNRGRNESWTDVYAQFALRPESPELHGIVQRRNETLSRADFEDLQRHCAARGVTVVPEIEAPGHALYITKWRPELALEGKKDLLNLSHPDTVPLVQAIWAEFLPWFETKEVHIGADEYDATLADDYIAFVNGMAEFVDATAGKKVRIWGTYEPSETRTISTDVIVQHWQYGQSDPVALARDGYELVNSQDTWAYMSLKNDHMPILPAPYPQLFNNTRVLNFGDRTGWQWEPALFNPVHVTQQPDLGSVNGAILAAWNDNGPDATTQLEAYYAVRNGIPVVASRAWAGRRGVRLDESSLAQSIDLLASNAVGQNLDRRLPGSPLIVWERAAEEEEEVILGYGSKGMNYSLTLDVTGPFVLSSNDAALSLTPNGTLLFTCDGWEYPLRSVAESDGFDGGHPGRIWINATGSTHEVITLPVAGQIAIKTDVLGGSRVWLDGRFVGRFEVFVFGGRNTLFSWSQMAFVAPLERLAGKGVQRLVVEPFGGHGQP